MRLEMGIILREHEFRALGRRPRGRAGWGTDGSLERGVRLCWRNEVFVRGRTLWVGEGRSGGCGVGAEAGGAVSVDGGTG